MLIHHNRDTQSRLQSSLTANRQLLEQIPLPVVLVNCEDGCITDHNGAMLESFGAITSIGEPINRLFKDDQAWVELPRECYREVREMISRKGKIHAEIHRTKINVLVDNNASQHWLVILVDVSVAHKQTLSLLQDALSDPLTKLANRRHFDDTAANLVQQRQKLAVLALDIDHFKRVNDTYGHDVGDQALYFVSQIFKRCLRECDLAARLGGEEFAALLPGATQAQAQIVGERIRQGIATNPVLLADDQFLTITISIGIAMLHTDEPDIQAALKRADRALYQAKQQGRNRVIVYTATTTEAQEAPLVTTNVNNVDKEEESDHPQLTG